MVVPRSMFRMGAGQTCRQICRLSGVNLLALVEVPIGGGMSARGFCDRAGFGRADIMTGHEYNNVPENVAKHVEKRLLQKPHHPLQILKSKIFEHFDTAEVERGGVEFEKYDSLVPVVSTKQCFDDLLIPKDHISRKPTDTFYVDHDTCLRPHTSAHQIELITSGSRSFLCAGDVYRRDEIDQSHYPVFHQMEGVKIFPRESNVTSEQVEEDLKKSLEGLVRTIFGDVEMRWVEAYFPFTDPSIELEIWFNDEWMEVLGCGVIHQGIMDNCGLGDQKGWAFGLGLERLAMVLFDIPDIRLFWTDDSRFHTQFTDGAITKFKPYSKYPPCLKDMSFWLPDNDAFHPNDLFSAIRDCAGDDLVERVTLIDEFTHPKTSRTSHCYRISYRSMDRSLTNEEIDTIQENIREHVTQKLGVELR
mmetsp:Transcript_17423/g.28117  ORF Transcript_17423/g.28117 Transcript_17423/m.28117 type:complete len:418 (-) Transcript_17423:43-1296(-)